MGEQEDSGGGGVEIVDALRARVAALEGRLKELKKFKSLADHTSFGTVLCDLDGTIVYVNEPFARMHGYSPEELVEEHWSILHDDSQLGRIETLVSSLHVLEQFTGQEVWHARRDGTRFPTLMDGQLLRDDDGMPRNLLMSAVNISAFEAVREELMFTHTGLDQAPDAALWMSTEGRFIYVNEVACRLLGYERRELLGMTAFDIDPSMDPERWAESWESLRTARTATMESMHRTKSGRMIPVEIKGSIVSFGENEYNCAFVRDITSRKRVERALRESEERFRNVVDRSPMAIHMYELRSDGALVFTGANPAAAALLGVHHATRAGQSIEEAFPNLSHTEVTARTRAAATTGEAWDASQIAYDPQRTLEMHVFQTSPGCAAVLFSDVTERCQMEERLRQSEKMQAIGQLAGGIAHDFNNQLTGIMGYAELLALGGRESDVPSLANKILKTSRRSAQLTSQLLAFARKGQYRTITVNVHALVREVSDILSRSIDKRIELRLRLAADSPCTIGDPSMLQNALLNLGINARDAMPEGGLLVMETENVALSEADCRLEITRVEPGRFVIVRVRDTGTGMAPSVQKRIFEPFFTTKKEGKGTGMGLAAVYGAVRVHRGAIRVRSVQGQGTTIEVLLPCHDGSPSDRPSEQPPPPSRGKARILLVDDESVVRDVGAKMLESLGYDVVCCQDGAEAVSLYEDQSGQIDLVVMDMVMPRMNGRDAFRRMKKLNPEARVLLCSGFSMDGAAQAMIEEGMLGFLDKPFDLATLAQRVEEALGDDDTVRDESLPEEPPPRR
jgi:two-component system, cell cycle sensor histidine kinase and response regulator CckA